MGTLPEEPIVIGEFEKNSKDTLKVSLQSYNGVDMVAIRVFYKDKDGNLKPGKHGVNIRVDQFPLFASILADAGKELKQRELL
jgi:hypothetical protein